MAMRWHSWGIGSRAAVILGVVMVGILPAVSAGAQVDVGVDEDRGSMADRGAGTTIVVNAAGTTGEEIIELAVNDEVVATWTGLSTTPTRLTAVIDQATVVERLRVHFTNDRWRPRDRNVVVDYVEVDGRRFESESPGNLSKGRWTSGDGCGEGRKRTEVLHCNGWIEYAGAVGLAVGATTAPLPVIFDTDMGPDIDDALALAMLHGYQGEGRVEIEAVTVSRRSIWGARYADLLNTFYGRPDIPIGIHGDTTPADGADGNWSRPVVETGRYHHDVHTGGPLPTGVQVMREVLAGAEDGSVVIVQTGFSGNLADLLTSGPDATSPLTGRELVATKVRLVSIMGGDNGSANAEFNVANDIAAAQVVFAQTPVPIIQSEFGLGYGLLYPLASIRSDFADRPNHPIPVSYLWTDLSWHADAGDRYDMRAWDLTSVLAAVEPPERYFEVSQPGRVEVDDAGRTRFTPTPAGNVTTLGHHRDYSDAEQAAIIDRLIELVTAPATPVPAQPTPESPPWGRTIAR